MRHERCIFKAEEDCPMKLLGISCTICDTNNLEVVIKRAVDDYTGMGEAYEALFAMLKNLFDSNGKQVDVKVPHEEILLINRVMTTLLSEVDPQTQEAVCYRRLIFYFFKILVDEFESEEYGATKFVH